MNYRRSPIALDGLVFVIPLGVISVFFFRFQYVVLGFVFSILTLFVLCFFRNPERSVPDGEGLVLSPADGRILSVDEVDDNEMLNGTYKKVSIFMSIFNVHVNRVPCSGKVKTIKYREGKFFSANLDKASEQNERNCVLIETDNGHEVLTIQIAGLIARRIVCWVKNGMKVTKGERFGLIKFGSRLEVFMPAGSEILVRPGEKVKAGETKMGYLP